MFVFNSYLLISLLKIKPLPLAEGGNDGDALHAGRHVTEARRAGHVVHELQPLQHGCKHVGQQAEDDDEGQDCQEVPGEDHGDEDQGWQDEEHILQEQLTVGRQTDVDWMGRGVGGLIWLFMLALCVIVDLCYR